MNKVETVKESVAEEPIQEQTEPQEPETQEEETQEPEEETDPEPEQEEEQEPEGEEETGKPESQPQGEFFELLKETYPSQSFDSEEDYLKAATQYMKDNLEANRVIGEAFENNPQLGDIIMDMTKGASFMEALARNVDMEALEPQPGDPDYKKWKEAKAEREERKQKAREAMIEQEKARNTSLETIEKFRTEKGMTPEERDQFATSIAKILDKVVIEGRVEPDFLELMYKGLAFDQAIDEARKQGEVRGKNEAIIQKKAKKATPGDGLPLVVPSNAPEVKKPVTNPIAAEMVRWAKSKQRFK